jgi:hypothetical protein
MQESLGARSRATRVPVTARFRSLAVLARRLRAVRLFHGEGQTYMGEAIADTGDRRLLPLATRLQGPALVRLAAALWRRREWPDLLGLGVRLFGRRRAARHAACVQDLLLATVPSAWRAPLGLLATDPHDFLANHYHALGMLAVDGVGPARVRARWRTPSPAGADRLDRLMTAVAEGLAHARLELQPRGSQEWLPLLALELRVPAAVEEDELRLSHFNDAGGLRASGLLQALRPADALPDALVDVSSEAQLRTSTGARR